ncbi:MAG: DUF58 domain-containing protein [Gammaproteobacteria bacterium]
MTGSFVLESLPAPLRSSTASYSDLTRQRVYILPTREGIVFALLQFALLLGAMNYNNSMAYILTFFLGGLFLVSILHTHRNLAGLIIRGSPPAPVFAGDTAQFPVIIDNSHGQARTALRLFCQPRRSLWGKISRKEYHVVEIDVEKGRKSQVCIPMAAERRGLLPLERVMISSFFPLGLFHAWSYLPIEQHCVVYPKPEGRSGLPAPAPGQQQGQAGAQNGANDFTGFRQYHPGDSIRTIAWKALAREQPLLVKRFSGDGSHNLLLAWEDTGHLRDSEARLSQLCRWILLAEAQGWNYGLNIPGTRIDPGRGLLHRDQCLEALARFGVGHAHND